MTHATTLGLDIGGATLKAATTDGRAWSRPFALWRSPEQLEDELRSFLGAIAYSRVAVTMTGELCDCFPTKEVGVRHILSSLANVVPKDCEFLVWQAHGRFVSPTKAIEDPWGTAAGNWLALATFVTRFTASHSALLVDVGSTTTDIIPIRNGQPVPAGRADPDRLASGELVYTGVVRTPVCALCKHLYLRRKNHRTMAELFATTLDVYLILLKIAENPDDTGTADGRPATRDRARDRLARMIGSDRSCFTMEDAWDIAKQIHATIREDCSAAVDAVVRSSLEGEVDLIIASGQGEFVIRDLPSLQGIPLFSLTEHLGSNVSQAACAYAVAILADERS